jgi:hypothetical protein
MTAREEGTRLTGSQRIGMNQLKLGNDDPSSAARELDTGITHVDRARIEKQR